MASTARIMLPLVAVLLTFAAHRGAYAEERLQVDMTLVQSASATGALCLDGSLPAYHLHRGSGAGAQNWLLQFEGGGWCNDVKSCLDRANTRRGSTKHMTKLKTFNGILSNNQSLNPDFYNWNRVKIRYCDGGSFAGDAVYENGTTKLHFKGQKIWEAIIKDLLPKGLGTAQKALLSGCSAGGLSAILHCDNFAQSLPKTSVKCLSDAGFFMDVLDVSRKQTVREFYKSLVALQGVQKNLNKECTSSLPNPELCIFPKWSLKFIKTPLFILNSAYDTFQFHHILVPPSSDPQGLWNRCRNDPAACNPDQIEVLQGFRTDMVNLVTANSKRGGMYINSCFAHCQSESQDTWLADDSPLVNNKKIAKAVGDWYFERNVVREIDCPYPCDRTCHNLIPAVTEPEEEKSKAADVV